MKTAGGFSIDVSPDEDLTESERAFLATLEQESGEEAPPVLSFRIHTHPLWPDSPGVNARSGMSARVFRDGRFVLIGHESFEARIDPVEAVVDLFRTDDMASGALPITLRIALGACLPHAGGVGLHAAGLFLSCVGVAFFGVSGSGKSTLSLAAQRPVLSDEFVGIVPDRGREGVYGPDHDGRRAPGDLRSDPGEELGREDLCERRAVRGEDDHGVGDVSQASE